MCLLRQCIFFRSSDLSTFLLMLFLLTEYMCMCVRSEYNSQDSDWTQVRPVPKHLYPWATLLAWLLLIRNCCKHSNWLSNPKISTENTHVSRIIQTKQAVFLCLEIHTHTHQLKGLKGGKRRDKKCDYIIDSKNYVFMVLYILWIFKSEPTLCLSSKADSSLEKHGIPFSFLKHTVGPW